MTEHTGRCACGSVEFVITDEPLFVNVCHCHRCQRESGSPFACNVLIEADRLELRSGAVAPIRVPTDSGRAHDIHRCTACGAPMWSIYERLSPIRFIRVGNFDLESRAALRPKAQIFTQSKLPWVVMPESLPAFDGFYDIKELWPQASIARLMRALGKA